MKNQVLHIILPTENTGFKIAELENWPGKVFIVPRASLKDLKDRPEVNSPAVYFLFGDSDEATKQKLYIGETETFLNRLLNHDQNKEFWNVAVIFIGGIDKAKVKYLEYVANKEAQEIGRFDLENGTVPKKPHLAEYNEMATLDYFEKVKYVLSVLGFPVFENIRKSLSDAKIYYLKGEGVRAEAQLLNDNSLVVFKGSLARIKQTESFWGWSLAARKRFLDDGTLVDNGDGVSYHYTKDVLFKSPSAAAATTRGASTNGWTAWKDEEGNTLDENLRK